MYEDFIGKKVIVRSSDAGVFIGTLVEVDNTTVKLSDCRNVWMWEGASCVMQIALEGIRGGKVSQSVPSIILTGVCQIIPLTEIAELSFNKIPEWRV